MGIINGGVACVCTKWLAFMHLCAFLRSFVRFCAFFPTKMGCRKAQIFAEFCEIVPKTLLCNTPFSYTPFCVSPTFPNALSVRKRSVTKGVCSGYLAHVPRYVPFYRGVSIPGCFPLFSGKVQIVSRTLSGLFLVGALNRLRKRKRTNRENPRTIPAQIGEIPEKSGKSEKDKKGQKRKDKSRSGNSPV